MTTMHDIDIQPNARHQENEMYGTSGVIGGSSLAMTGLSVGSSLLSAIGLLFMGGALLAFVRRNPRHSP